LILEANAGLLTLANAGLIEVEYGGKRSPRVTIPSPYAKDKAKAPARPCSGENAAWVAANSRSTERRISIRCGLTALRPYACRFPGVAGGRFAGDIVRPLLGRDLCVEVKVRPDGFRELYCCRNQRNVLIVKADRQEPLVVVRLSLAMEVANRVV